MTSSRKFHLAIFAAGLSLAGSACVHTPPGTSVKVALAKKAELVRFAEQPVPAGSETTGPAVEPELPNRDNTEAVAEAFTRGGFCMRAGKDQEAIEAFEETIQIDPNFADAWQTLAVLYEKTGQEEKAVNAFRNAKRIAQK